MSFLGLDIGAVFIRALVVDAQGNVLTRVQRRHGAGKGTSECQLDARVIWEDVRRVLGQVADQARSDPVTALATSAPGDAIVPLSLEGQPLMPCLLGNDQRGSGYLAEIVDLLGPEHFHDLTGRLSGESTVLNKLCWMRDHASGVYRSTAIVSTLGGYIARQLGVSGVTDHTQAGIWRLYDINRLDWSTQALRACDLAPEKMPEVRPAGTILGTMPGILARELGFTGRPLVVLGADDLACTSLGAGIVRPGQTLYYLGTRFHLVPLYEAIPLRRMLYVRGLEVQPHLPVGMLTSAVSYPIGGNALSWLLDVLSPLERREALRSGQNPYHMLIEEMPDEPASVLVLPGEAHAGGSLVVGVSTETTRGEIVRGVLEGLALQAVEGQQRLLEVGIPLEVYRATGGGARSDGWLQLTADACGYPLERTAEEQTAPLGAAVLAAAGSGALGGIDAAVESLVRVVDRFEPAEDRAALYAARQARLREMRNAFSPED